jgi:hypothetical protein
MIFDLRVLGVWLRAALRSWYARTILTGNLADETKSSVP